MENLHLRTIQAIAGRPMDDWPNDILCIAISLIRFLRTDSMFIADDQPLPDGYLALLEVMCARGIIQFTHLAMSTKVTLARRGQ